MENKLYKGLIAKLKTAKKENQPVFLEDDTVGNIDTKMLYISYIGSRWATGKETVQTDDGPYQVPYTINYAALFLTAPSGVHKVKLHFAGDDSFV